MLKQLLNECSIDIVFHTEGPILVKSGTIDVNGLDMNFVKTLRKKKDEIYIPGSSLKGLIRSYSEKIVRTLSADSVKCCDPFNNGSDQQKRNNSISCSQKFEWRKKGVRIKPDGKQDAVDKEKEELLTSTVYADACPICKLFGSTSQASRFFVEDGYLVDFTQQERHRQQRDGVGIDRFTGGTVDGAKFELEVFSFLDFKSRIFIKNFEVWQLGLLAYALYDFQQGLAKIGYGKSRGLGNFKAQLENLTISYLVPTITEKTTPHNPEFFGLRNLFKDNSYEFAPTEKEPLIVKDIELPRDSDGIGLRRSYVFKKEHILPLFKTLAHAFNKFLNDWDWRDKMKFTHFKHNEES